MVREQVLHGRRAPVYQSYRLHTYRKGFQVGVLPDWLTELERNSLVHKNGLNVLYARILLAHLHLTVLKVMETTKKTQRSIMTIKLARNAYFEKTLRLSLGEERMRLASMIVSEFQSSLNPAHKAQLLDELKNIPHNFIDDDLVGSHLSILTASALQVVVKPTSTIGTCRSFLVCVLLDWRTVCFGATVQVFGCL